MPSRATEERIAKNDATFREANEKIAARADELDVTAERVPFICECADTACFETASLLLEEYEHVRSNPRWFINVPGHQSAEQGAASVVEAHERHVIVEKEGHAGEVAEQAAESGTVLD